MSSNEGFQGVSNCYVFKSRLQEYAQKVKFSTPVYETIKEGPSHEPTFRSTVIVNDVRYDSLPGFFNRKAAEQSAAEVALMALCNSGAMNECVSQPVHESGLCKNLLQEYAQKMNYAIPSYECQKEEKPGRLTLFSCTVEIGGIRYIGAAARSKKEAEIKAARTALLAIQSASYESSEKLGGNTMYTVLPGKKKVTDLGINPQETAEALKPRKGRFKKKSRKKRRRGGGFKNFQGNNMGNSDINIDGQAGLELNQIDPFVIQVTHSGLLPMEALRNFQDERSNFTGDEEELSAGKGALAPFSNGDSNDGHLTALNFHPSDLENSNLGISSMICGGDFTALVNEVNKVSGVAQLASMVNNSTVWQGEVPSGIDGLNQNAYGTDAGQTISRTIGA